MMTVPFENLDIHLGIPIVLSVPAFFEKIVGRRRGGFCYELNGLFAWLLAELGFAVVLHSARVFSGAGVSPEFDHLVLSVQLQDRWIADVGFGDSSLEPLRIAPDDASNTEGYSIVESAGTLEMQRQRHRIVEPLYVLTLEPRRLDEFEARSRFQQTSPDSHFTRSTVCSRATPDGRITLSGRRLIVTSGDRRDERELRGRDEYRRVLEREFGIALTDFEADRLARAAFPLGFAR